MSFLIISSEWSDEHQQMKTKVLEWIRDSSLQIANRKSSLRSYRDALDFQMKANELEIVRLARKRMELPLPELKSRIKTMILELDQINKEVVSHFILGSCLFCILNEGRILDGIETQEIVRRIQ